MVSLLWSYGSRLSESDEDELLYNLKLIIDNNFIIHSKGSGGDV